MDDMIRAGRDKNAKGEGHGMAKLTEIDIKRIRLLSRLGRKQCELARRYGTSEGNISRIIHGVKWRHVPFLLPVNAKRKA